MTDLEYTNNKFSRNLRLNFKANFDDDYKYKGFTGGFTYALVNCRDEKLAKLGDEVLPFLEAVNNYQREKAKLIVKGRFDNDATSKMLEELKVAVDAALNNEAIASNYKDNVNSKNYLAELKKVKFKSPVLESNDKNKQWKSL